jgi:hypothetical protein
VTTEKGSAPQTVKYMAVRNAHLKWKPETSATTAILVTSRKLSPTLRVLRDCLGVDVREGIVASYLSA